MALNLKLDIDFELADKITVENLKDSYRRLGEDIERLESEITEGLRYKGWINPYFSVTDGAQLHGWDSVEVVYDEKKPLQVSLNMLATMIYCFL